MTQKRIGVIGGSGLYQIDGLARQRWMKVATPFGRPSDDFLLGEIAGREVVFLPRHGRGHRLLPSELNHRANSWAMKKLGVAWIVSVGSVGSLQTRYKPCDIVFIDQFVDHTKKSAEHTFFGTGIVAHVAFAHPICEELRRLLMKSARTLKARVHDGGTYVNMEGPAFSTRAESIANHQGGHAVIGMTNLGEARCAREAEIAYATLAMVTDYDAWKPDEDHVTDDRVIDAKEKGIEVDTFTQELGKVDRAILDGETEGFVRIHVRKGQDEIVGATIVAARAGDLIGEVTLAMKGKLGLKTIAGTIHPYPTQAESIRKTGDLYNRTRLTPFVKRLMNRWLAWQR